MNYIKDANGNTVSYGDHRSRDEAQAMLDSLVNCRDCSDYINYGVQNVKQGI